MELGSSLSMLAGPAGGWLMLAFGLGLVHALDADHVMAMSVFSTGRAGAWRGVRAGLRWALGHGAIVLGAGVLVLLLGRALPVDLASWADRGVGGLMIALGAYVFFELARRRSHLHFHAHDGLVPHAHWHSHDSESPAHRHEHGALMVGALHGLAGSAPILAVLPAAARSPMLGLAYLLVFGFAVALAMALVSGLLGHLTARLSRPHHETGLSALRAISATGSITVGVWLVWAA